MTELSKDVAVVLAPVQALGQRLSAGERCAIDQACEDVLRICEDEEQAAQRMCDMVQELEQRLEDCHCGASAEAVGGHF